MESIVLEPHSLTTLYVCLFQKNNNNNNNLSVEFMD